ncbi:hydrogenase maturation nickel metallochaperone HypA [Nocardioides sp. KR10-350]|uniref:hydrogenase maturation nickel metallochaperone HypA/HybF n=1 Tax=Nocardioides cheoyonin TaxID=3156615 RepID=UPI0032B57018
MHELSLTESLVDVVEERLAGDLAGRTVVTVHLRVGREAGVMADAMAFCWDVVTAATPLAGSRLEIEETAGDELALASVELLKEESGV